MGIKLLIAGSRDFLDYDLLCKHCDSFIKSNEVEEIVSGGARGADYLGELYSKSKNIKLTVFNAEWRKYGKSAGYRRNVHMGNYCDKALIFWDGKSKGTKHMIELLKSLGKDFQIIQYKGE